VDRVRYVGEPVAVALARNRDTAEDVLERIVVEYRPLPPIVDPEAAARPDAPPGHRVHYREELCLDPRTG
jgi:2-furoyl-CoA dehydrogenase large subunit